MFLFLSTILALTANVPLCGNGIIDKGEQCDGGGMGLSGLDPCCSRNCKFIGNSTCRYKMNSGMIFFKKIPSLFCIWNNLFIRFVFVFFSFLFFFFFFLQIQVRSDWLFMTRKYYPDSSSFPVAAWVNRVQVSTSDHVRNINWCLIPYRASIILY